MPRRAEGSIPASWASSLKRWMSLMTSGFCISSAIFAESFSIVAFMRSCSDHHHYARHQVLKHVHSCGVGLRRTNLQVGVLHDGHELLVRGQLLHSLLLQPTREGSCSDHAVHPSTMPAVNNISIGDARYIGSRPDEEQCQPSSHHRWPSPSPTRSPQFSCAWPCPPNNRHVNLPS